MNTVIKTTPNLNRLFSEIMNMNFDRFFKDDHFTGAFIGQAPVNIHETDNAFELELVAPGREKADFQVQINGDVLTIGYEKKATETTEGKKLVRREFRTESFKRTFTLNDKVDATGIAAEYINGILKVVLPKKEEVKVTPAKIEVK